MKIADLYTFEAEMSDGTIITTGDDIAGAVRVSLIPAPGCGLPQHDLIGLPFVRRFTRNFKRTTIGGFDREAYLASIIPTEARLAARAARDAAGRYEAQEEERVESDQPPKKPKPDNCVQVIVIETCRVYVSHLDGSVLVTPPDFELYL